jgi:hypothetical protein
MSALMGSIGALGELFNSKGDDERPVAPRSLEPPAATG